MSLKNVKNYRKFTLNTLGSSGQIAIFPSGGKLQYIPRKMNYLETLACINLLFEGDNSSFFPFKKLRFAHLTPGI